MKIYFSTNKTNTKEYATRLIKKVLASYMVDSPEEADVVMVSICDISEIGDAVRARNFGKPVLAGGMVSEYPVLNELVDYVWHGEVYGLKRQLDSGVDFINMESITTPTKRTLLVDQYIDWLANPIVKVGKRAMYYYTSKGCPLKCKYCLIGNIRDYQVVPEGLYARAVAVAGKNLMPIAAYNPYGVPSSANIGEVLLRKYAAGVGHGSGAKMIRTGVEFVNSRNSKTLAKGVTIDHVNEGIARAGAEGTRLIMYLIAGIESQEELEDFFSQLSLDYRISPSITFVFTYIDPQPFTPFHDFDLRRKITDIDTKRLYRIATECNKRVRMLPLARPEKATIRSLLGRATSRQEYAMITKLSKEPLDAIIETIERRAPHLLGRSSIDEIASRPRVQITADYWSRP